MKQPPRRTAPVRPGRAAAKELVFEIKLDARGSFFVECLAENIVSPPGSPAQVRANLKRVVEALYFGHTRPGILRLQLVRDEILALG